MGSQLPPKWGTAPQFSVHVYCGQGWMDEDATWYGSRSRPRPHCVRRGPRSPRERGTAPPPLWPMSIVTTVANLSYCWALFWACRVCSTISCLSRSVTYVETLAKHWQAFVFLHEPAHLRTFFKVCVTEICLWLIDWVKVLRHIIGHFGDALPSQLISWCSTEPNTTQEQNSLSQVRKTRKMLDPNKHTKTKPKPKPTLSVKNYSLYMCASLCTTAVVHNTE